MEIDLVLEKAANTYIDNWYKRNNLDKESYPIDVEISKNDFKAGAEWQKKQFENNRLTHCDVQTEKESEIEYDFVMGIIKNEHRLPTFDDAIKYGMRLKEKEIQSTIELAEDHAIFAGMEKMKEEMMEKAIEGIARPDDNEIWCDLDSFNLKDGDKCRVIVIKED